MLALKHAVNYRGLGDYHLKELLRLLAAEYIYRLAIRTDCGVFYASTQDTVILHALLHWGQFEDADTLPLALDCLTDVGAAPGADTLLLDIGANIGTTTVVALTRGLFPEVVACEPDPGNLEVLQQNIAANQLSERVRVLPYAISDADTTVTLELSPDNLGDNRVRVAGAPTDAPTALAETRWTTIPVAARRLDSLIADGSIALDRVGLVWMDVQGHEAHVLRGANQLLALGLPLVMEFWPYGLRRAGGLEALQAMLQEHYTHVIDLGAARRRASGRPAMYPITLLPELTHRYVARAAAGAMTDLLFIKRAPAAIV
jgi:FkbM family methyltransferase